MTKTTRKHTKSPHQDGESALQMVTGMLGTGLSGLQLYIEHMSEVVGESTNPEAAESFAHVLTKVAQVASELRKAEAAERKNADGISKAEILEAVRLMDQTDRARFVRELVAIDQRKSGLA